MKAELAAAESEPDIHESLSDVEFEAAAKAAEQRLKSLIAVRTSESQMPDRELPSEGRRERSRDLMESLVPSSAPSSASRIGSDNLQ